MRPLHVVVPDGVEDPARPSGGNTYDRRICRGLAESGRPVRIHPVPGSWPRPDAKALAALAVVLRGIPDGSVALLDGLVASTAPEVLVPHAGRLRLVPLVHMPLGAGGEDEESRRREGAVLAAAASVITTSAWSRRTLVELYSLPEERVHVAEPGVDAGFAASGTPGGEALLCVAAVVPGKGHDVLVSALARVAERRWECVCVGSLEREPAFVKCLRRRLSAEGLAGRVHLAGAMAEPELERSYEAADLLVLPSRAETYGMVVTEALARGLPVVASDVGGVTEALGHGGAGATPGRLVPADDPPALAGALRAWLGRPEIREAWRRTAHERRASLRGWPETTSVLAEVLAEAAR